MSLGRGVGGAGGSPSPAGPCYAEGHSPMALAIGGVLRPPPTPKLVGGTRKKRVLEKLKN